MYGSIFMQISAVGSNQKTHLFCNRARFGRSSHPRSMILVPIESVFFLPLSHSAPSLPMFPLEFWGEVNHEETRVMGLSYGEDRMIVAWVVLTQCQRVTDRRTDGFTIVQRYA